MTKEQQAQLGVLANPKMSSQNWYTDASGDMYLADPETLIEVKDLKSTNIPNAKMKFEKDMSQFITGMDLLMSMIKANDANSITSQLPFIKTADLKVFNGIPTDELITITSGLRSLQDNTRAYRNDLTGSVVSDHMRGQSLDIRTEPGNPNYKAGQAFWKFLNTPSGAEFLKSYNMNALYHDAGTGYHIDITRASKRRPAGGVRKI